MMLSRNRIFILVFLLVLGFGGGAAFHFFGKKTRPNVVLLLLDTLRADHLSGYGYERDTSPNLRQFGEENLQAEWAMTAAPWTPPSVASIFSGMYVSSHGLMPPRSRQEAKRGAAKLPPSIITLSEMLHEVGYQTAAVSPNPWISQEFGFSQGFDTFTYIPRARALEVNQAGQKIVETFAEKRDPFFLYLHYLDPHDPYDPPEEYQKLFSGALKQGSYSDDALRRMGLYDGEIRYLDHALGELFSFFKTKGLYEDMVLVIVGDHGEQFGEHGNFTHGYQLFNTEVHVPLLVKVGSHGPQGQKIDVTVSTVDVLPTILEGIGIKAPPHLQGVSLLNKDALSKRAGVLSEINRRYNQRAFTSFNGQKLIVGSKDLKDREADASDPSKNIVGVFDRVKDPLELSPVVDENILSNLQMEFRALYAEVDSRKVGKTEQGEVSDSTIDNLKSLGYLQ